MNDARIKYIEQLAPGLLMEMLKGFPCLNTEDVSKAVKNSVTAAGLLFDELQAQNAAAKDR